MNQLDQVRDLKPRVMTLPLDAVGMNLVDESPFASIKGMGTAVITPQAAADFIKLVGLDPKTLRNVREYNDKTGRLVLKTAIDAHKKEDFVLVFDKDAPRITRIVKPDAKKTALRPHQMVGIAEMMVEKGMSVWGVQTSPDGTAATINLVNPEIHHHPLMNQESVQIGRTIHFDALGGTSFNAFLQRMWCSNGATLNEEGKHLGEIYDGMDTSQLFELLFVKGAEKRLGAYFNKVSQFQDMMMSVREWRELEKYLLPFSDDKKAFQDHIGFELGNQPWEKAYTRKGVKLEDETQQQLRNRTTPIKWWDAINLVTWLGSHDTVSKVSDWDKGQMNLVGGALINRKNFDSQAWVKDNPAWN